MQKKEFLQGILINYPFEDRIDNGYKKGCDKYGTDTLDLEILDQQIREPEKDGIDHEMKQAQGQEDQRPAYKSEKPSYQKIDNTVDNRHNNGGAEALQMNRRKQSRHNENRNTENKNIQNYRHKITPW